MERLDAKTLAANAVLLTHVFGPCEKKARFLQNVCRSIDGGWSYVLQLPATLNDGKLWPFHAFCFTNHLTVDGVNEARLREKRKRRRLALKFYKRSSYGSKIGEEGYLDEELVPRINGAIPSADDASFDHQRLLDRLTTYGLSELKVSGDGNCQFRALSDQLYNSPEYHKHVRKEVVKQLKKFRSAYEAHVPMRYKHYYRKMRKAGEWGDHVTLQAAADRFSAKICLLTSFRDTCFIEIMPREQSPQRELWLSFWSEVHYNSLYDVGEVPYRAKQKKKHWLF